MIHDELGNRMKGYENTAKTYLERKIPVIIRIDGKAFHSFTKGFKKPFDKVFRDSMNETMRYLCDNIQGCVFGYTQSDEITLVLIDYQNEDTDAWFGYGVQKMASVAASMATMAFNRAFILELNAYAAVWHEKELEIAPSTYANKAGSATFDARAFSLPKEEVVNCLIWRQKDAIRNSILSVGQFYFSHKELQGKKQSDVLEMLKEKGINWEADYPIEYQRGTACKRKERPSVSFVNGETIKVIRNNFVIDYEMPLFWEEKEYVNECI